MNIIYLKKHLAFIFVSLILISIPQNVWGGVCSSTQTEILHESGKSICLTENEINVRNDCIEKGWLTSTRVTNSGNRAALFCDVPTGDEDRCRIDHRYISGITTIKCDHFKNGHGSYRNYGGDNGFPLNPNKGEGASCTEEGTIQNPNNVEECICDIDTHTGTPLEGCTPLPTCNPWEELVGDSCFLRTETAKCKSWGYSSSEGDLLCDISIGADKEKCTIVGDGNVNAPPCVSIFGDTIPRKIDFVEIDSYLFDRTEEITDDSEACKEFGGEVVVVEGGEICKGVDESGTFCIVDSKRIFPCRGLFKRAKICNIKYNRRLLNPFTCGEKCKDNEGAFGNQCSTSLP